MTAVDTNILVYAHRRDSQSHVRAAARLGELAQRGVPWMIPWPCLHEFLAIVTSPRIYKPASTILEAFRQIEYWLESPGLSLQSESEQHLSILRHLADTGHIAGGQFHDARVAAICLGAGASMLWTADRDFSRFPAMQTENPLVE